ncbi:MAG TPA: hypothetical protein PLQ04_04120 [Lachnospiraceae bacterium]|nr:hypothetical protein [Lachnospiraceae bacterium]
MICLFKCPGCGDDMRFDVETQMLICDVCGHSMSPSEYDLSMIRMEQKTEQTKRLQCYHCPSCAATLMRDKEQVTCICAYCGTDMAVFDDGEGKYRPDKIIAFKVTKEEARNKFAKWWGEHDILPKFIPGKMNLEIRGIYIPVWLVNADTVTNMIAIVSKEKYIDYSKPYDEYTKYYYQRIQEEKEQRSQYISMNTIESKVVYLGVKRKIFAEYRKIPSISSLNFSQSRFHGVEPYDYSQLENFTPAYLSGFPAEQYYLKPEDILPKSLKRIGSYGKEQCTRHIIAGTGGKTRIEKVSEYGQQIEPREVEYALVPLWICSYYYGGKCHYVYVNGQTGKTDGEVIEDAGKFRKESLFQFLSYFVLCLPLFLLLGIFINPQWFMEFISVPFILFVATLLPGILKQKGRGLRKAGRKEQRYTDEIQYRKKSILKPDMVLLLRIVIGMIGLIIALNCYSLQTTGDITGARLIGMIVLTLLSAMIFTYSFQKKYRATMQKREEVEYTDYLKPYGTKVLTEETTENV